MNRMNPWCRATIIALFALVALAAASALALEAPPIFLLKWGGPGAGPGQFSSPRGVAVGPDGTVYVADGGNRRVQRFTDQGVFLSQWSTVDLNLDLAIDADGNVYVLGNAQIRKYDGAGTFLTSWTGGGGGGGIAVDRAGQFVYVSILNLVFKYTTDGDSLDMWTAGSGGNFGEVNDDLAVGPSGEIYVMGGRSGTMRVFAGDGTLVRQWPVPGVGVGVNQDERVFVALANSVGKYTSDGTPLTQWGTFGSGDGQFGSPRGIEFDGDGNIYVCDTGNHRIQKFGDVVTPVAKATWGAIKARYLK